MIKLFLSATAILMAVSIHAQQRIKEYVQQHTVPVNSIQPDVTDYSDLEPIGEAIGDASIVMLGEQDHGDAPTFLAKTRLIKYLHEQKGFNVLAFESDFFGLNHGWDQVAKTKDSLDSFIAANIFGIWTHCFTCRELLYNYIPASHQTNKPLQITGFDNQMTMLHSTKYLLQYLDSSLRAIDAPITKQENYSLQVLPLIDSIQHWSYKDTANFQRVHNYLSDICAQVVNKMPEQSFFMALLNNLIEENRMHVADTKKRLSGMNVRDRRMAENLKWLKTNKYPNEKIIVWAANAHVADYVYNDPAKDLDTLATMGYYLKLDNAFAKTTYIIGFTSYGGYSGRLNPGFPKYAIRAPQKNAFETWIAPELKYAFTDFKKFNTQQQAKAETFHLKGLGHQTAFKSVWNKSFDGIFFIKEMYSCRQE